MFFRKKSLIKGGNMKDLKKAVLNDPFFNPAPIHSSVAEKGRYVTQVITTVGGIVKTIRGIDTSTIQKGEFTHFDTKDGRKIMVNTPNVLFVETQEEK